MKRKLKIPLKLLALDWIGTVFMVLGVLEWKETITLVPTSFQFEYYPFVIIFVGVLFMFPFFLFILNKGKAKRIREI